MDSLKSTSEVLTLYRLNTQTVNLSLNKELEEKFIKVDINKCYGRFSYELTHSSNRREIVNKDRVSMIFNVSEIHPDVDSINFSIKPENVTEDYFKFTEGWTNRTEVALSYKYFKTQTPNNVTLSLKNDTVSVVSENNSVNVKFVGYSEPAVNITPIYNFYLYNTTDFHGVNVCDLQKLNPLTVVVPENSLEMISFNLENLATGNYTLVVAAHEKYTFNLMLPYQPVSFSFTSADTSSGHAGLIAAIIIILVLIAGAAAFFYFRRVSKKTADDNKAINSSEKLLA
jgi:hypothetical protein